MDAWVNGWVRWMVGQTDIQMGGYVGNMESCTNKETNR